MDEQTDRETDGPTELRNNYIDKQGDIWEGVNKNALENSDIINGCSLNRKKVLDVE